MLSISEFNTFHKVAVKRYMFKGETIIYGLNFNESKVTLGNVSQSENS